MRKSRLLFVTICILSLLFIGCGDDNGDGNGDDNGDGDDNGGASCDTTDPEGNFCTGPDNCEVECECEDGVVTAGRCITESCGDAAGTCESACDDQGGYTGDFCYVGDEPDEGGGDLEYGDECTEHADCDGWTGDPSTSEWFCIEVCDHQFCANDCSDDFDCPSFDSCDPVMGSCIPEEYDC